MRGSAVFVAPDTVATVHAFAARLQAFSMLRSFRIRVGESAYPGTLTGVSADWRLVCLSARGLEGSTPVWRPSRTLKLGEKVTIVAGCDAQVRGAQGDVAALTPTRARQPYERHFEIETTVPAWPDSVGAGLFDAQGHVIGVAVDVTREGRIVAAPADWLAVGSHKHTARVLMRDGRIHEAAPELRRLAERADGAEGRPDPELWSMLAVCYEATGRTVERLAALRRAVALDGENAWIAYSLGTALLQQPSGREEALAWLERAVALEPTRERYRLAVVRLTR
jgi:hypothetical protein